MESQRMGHAFGYLGSSHLDYFEILGILIGKGGFPISRRREPNE
jgi:hypothetical protein